MLYAFTLNLTVIHCLGLGVHRRAGRDKSIKHNRSALGASPIRQSQERNGWAICQLKSRCGMYGACIIDFATYYVVIPHSLCIFTYDDT